MKKTLKFALASAFLAAAPALIAAGSEQSCKDIQAAIESAVKADEAKVLEVVEAQVSASAGCACEVVKAAIIATEADKGLVRQIVEVAVIAAPDEMRLIAQCAVAVAPDSVGEVQKVIASFEPQSGSSSYSSKGGLSKGGGKGQGSPSPQRSGIANPLDGPGNAGGPGADNFLPQFVVFQPFSITPNSFGQELDLGDQPATDAPDGMTSVDAPVEDRSFEERRRRFLEKKERKHSSESSGERKESFKEHKGSSGY